MSVRPLLLALVGALVIPAAAPDTAVAQDDARPMIYASYFRCDPAGEEGAMEIVRDIWAPIVRTHMDAGHVDAWGLITHHTGGPWRQALYHVGSDRAALLGAMDAMVAEFGADHPDAAAEYSTICPTHDDYIWIYVTGSDPAEEVAQTRPVAGLSTYWVCEEGRESLADLLTEEVFAPIYDQQVAEGLLNSWGWYSHFVGGKWRRLLVLDGSDHESLLQARGAVIRAIRSEHPDMGAEFSRVCDGHTDYLWDIAIAEP
jgi:hypothetical protein